MRIHQDKEICWNSSINGLVDKINHWGDEVRSGIFAPQNEVDDAKLMVLLSLVFNLFI
jgi:hypothetical protein